jgi:hypothetical protein
MKNAKITHAELEKAKAGKIIPDPLPPPHPI